MQKRMTILDLIYVATYRTKTSVSLSLSASFFSHPLRHFVITITVNEATLSLPFTRCHLFRLKNVQCAHRKVKLPKWSFCAG